MSIYFHKFGLIDRKSVNFNRSGVCVCVEKFCLTLMWYDVKLLIFINTVGVTIERQFVHLSRADRIVSFARSKKTKKCTSIVLALVDQ